MTSNAPTTPRPDGKASSKARRARGRRFVVGALALMGLGALVALVIDVATFRRDAWLADYAQLKVDLAQGYANLDWMVAHRGLDLPALDARTTAALEGSVSRLQAWIALDAFVEAFDDPHVSLAWTRSPSRSIVTSDWHRPQAGASSATAPAPTRPPVLVEDCRSAGYEAGEVAFRLPVTNVAGWEPLADGPFPMGRVGDTGVLRIAAFGENQYLTECEAAFTGREPARALQLKVRARLQAQLEAQLGQLRDLGIRRLVVDITGNGGGSEWVRQVIPLFTSRPMTRRAALGPTPRCDRMPIWRGEAVCPLLEDQGEEESLQGRGLWDGPLALWIDGGTASASEDFAAWLSDNHVAVLVGSPTVGAGCGYVAGGHVSVLPASGLQVRMPNCARFLRDGRNEIEGLAPHHPSGFLETDLPRLLALP
jgi:hypothetical protein